MALLYSMWKLMDKIIILKVTLKEVDVLTINNGIRSFAGDNRYKTY